MINSPSAQSQSGLFSSDDVDTDELPSVTSTMISTPIARKSREAEHVEILKLENKKQKQEVVHNLSPITTCFQTVLVKEILVLECIMVMIITCWSFIWVLKRMVLQCLYLEFSLKLLLQIYPTFMSWEVASMQISKIDRYLWCV